MPGNKEVFHPILNYKITFTEESHSYIDNKGRKYISVTTLVSNAFPKFNSEEQAEKYSKKHGLDKNDVLALWTKKGKDASTAGTRLHENCENYILNKLDNLHSPKDIQEKMRFDGGIKIIDAIKKKFNPASMQPELLVFSPAFCIAGSIDLLVKMNDNNYIIFDWKCLSKDIEKEGFRGECGNIVPTLKIQHSNYWHYALQLQIYEYILKCEGYINQNANVKKCLLIWNGKNFKIEELPDLPEAWGLMLWKDKINFEN